ncbi:hypothetical protein J0X14_06350 [Muricauda sp. CAU 1633]|uniref:hypothetical protein n=1 Tax=Allomuricauda sp. CAU 1633 TaxID=2816036 RepID=UPI001A8FD4B4|nr:hypothetical protein [Muricauda sp. CAU 1633]MBO0321909.1 hypothetical protein [Muricauda sp. CAU 1633]
MKKIVFKLLALTFSLMALMSCSDDDYNGDVIGEDPTIPLMFGINAKGTVTGKMVENYELPGTDLTVSGNAFEMTMFNPATDEAIGTVIDINVDAQTFEDGSMFGENYTVFLFEDSQNSSLVLHNLIEMIPAPPANMNAFIKRENTLDNVVGGTGIYSSFVGGSTLNASLDMKDFAENKVGFDCLYGFTKMLH